MAQTNTSSRLPRFQPSILSVLVVVLLSMLSGPRCSCVEFEISPYAPRGLDIVYSHQEDITFFVWRVGNSVDFDRVDFELFIDGDYRQVDLNDAPFPSHPFDCDRIYQCVQYQIPGTWNGSGDHPPVRAIDARHGLFDSTEPRHYDVDTTFEFDPVAVDNNVAAMARLDDWFSNEKVPLRRSFQWTLVPASGDPNMTCPTDPAHDWGLLEERVNLPHDWMDSTPCFAIRPDREDQPGVQIRSHLTVGAMLYAEDIRLPIPEIRHPTLVAFLVDLEIINEDRCNRAIRDIRSQVFETLDERNTTHQSLGTFRPIDPDGFEHSGCDQTAGARYPVDDILVRVHEKAATYDVPTTLLVVYLNNLDLPPSEAKRTDLDVLFEERDSDANPHYFKWTIGSNTTSSLYQWDQVTPWAPIEDENFLPGIESAVNFNFPLRSTDFDGDDSVSLYRPNPAGSPQYFRLCTFTPTPVSVGLPPDLPVPYIFDTWDWPGTDEPELYFDIPPQEFIAYSSFLETRVSGVYEVCDDYCDHPFLSSNGAIHDSWLTSPGVCRWQ